MMCLDTNVVIAVLNRRPRHVAYRLGEALRSGTVFGLPSIALYELRYGFARSDRRERMDALLLAFLSPGIEVLPFTSDDAHHAGEIRAALEAVGTPIGAYDYLIAAQARARGATLVTANAREFARVPGLLVVDWTE
jgi:tRNA(fMet)-specific endonuclease VapC